MGILDFWWLFSLPNPSTISLGVVFMIFNSASHTIYTNRSRDASSSPRVSVSQYVDLCDNGVTGVRGSWTYAAVLITKRDTCRAHQQAVTFDFSRPVNARSIRPRLFTGRVNCGRRRRTHVAVVASADVKGPWWWRRPGGRRHQRKTAVSSGRAVPEGTTTITTISAGDWYPYERL